MPILNERFVEKLIEMNLLPIMIQTCKEVYETHFQTYFDELCAVDCYESFKNTTLGATFNHLQSIARTRIESQIHDLSFNTYINDLSPQEKSFKAETQVLFNHFMQAIDVRDYVSDIMGDYFHEKQTELFSKGILDEHGDFINGNKEAN